MSNYQSLFYKKFIDDMNSVLSNCDVIYDANRCVECPFFKEDICLMESEVYFADVIKKSTPEMFSELESIAEDTINFYENARLEALNDEDEFMYYAMCKREEDYLDGLI